MYAEHAPTVHTSSSFTIMLTTLHSLQNFKLEKEVGIAVKQVAS